MLALGVVHDVVHHGVHVLVLHRRQVDAAHVAMHADHRRQAGDRCRSEALFLTAKASSSVMSMRIVLKGACILGNGEMLIPKDYERNRLPPASSRARIAARAHGILAGRDPRKS
jgi:hypothetical protein